MKRIILFWIKSILFVMILGVLLQRASLVLQVWGTEKGEPDRRNCLFFTLPQNTVDCLFIGTSHIYCSFIPKQIYEETGITSACLATSAQSYQNTYWLLREALKKQHPKAVVMDIHSVTTQADEQVRNFRLHYTSGITIMPDLSLQKMKAYYDIKSKNTDWVENMSIFDAYGFLEYKGDHKRNNHSLKELCNLLFTPVKEFTTLGFYPTTTVFPIEELTPDISTDRYIDFYSTIEYEYLSKICDLLEENGITLIMTRMPYTRDNFDDCHLYEQAYDWMMQKNIRYVDFFPILEEIGIDKSRDFRDEDHLNINGAKKATLYFEEYLLEHFQWIDHRGDGKYKLWERCE